MDLVHVLVRALGLELPSDDCTEITVGWGAKESRKTEIPMGKTVQRPSTTTICLLTDAIASPLAGEYIYELLATKDDPNVGRDIGRGGKG